MRPTQRKNLNLLLKWLVNVLIFLFAWNYPFVVLTILGVIIGIGVLSLLFLNKVMKWFEDSDFTNLFK